MKIVGFVPAKSNSTRLKNKNNLNIGGVPLFINAALNLSKVIPKKNIYIDTDSYDFIECAKKYGFSHIKRSSDKTLNSFNGNDLLMWEVNSIDCDIAVQHLPTMPFLKKETLDKSISAVIGGYDSVLASYEESFYTWSKNTPDYDILNIPNSFELDKKKIEGMGIYVVNKNKFVENKTRVFGKIFNINLSHFERVDINYEEDYLFAKNIFTGFKD